MGHFYSKTGEPVYEVPNVSKGGMRDTTLRDAKKLGLVPSVTTITGVVSRPELDNWKTNQVLEACLRVPRNQCKSIEEWKARVIKESQEVSKSAATIGNEIHNDLELYFTTGNIEDFKHPDFVFPVIELIKQEFPNEKFKSEIAFCDSECHFGGKIDLISDNCIIDFKTKIKEDVSDVKISESYGLQLAAYHHGMNINPSDNRRVCYNLYISSAKAGNVKLVKLDDEDLMVYKTMFHALLRFWQLSNGV